MSDRLPQPVCDEGEGPLGARASATPDRHEHRTHREARGPAPAPTKLPLRESQVWMVEAIMGPESKADDADAMLTAGPRLTGRERFETYRHAYRARLVECLADDYPVIADTLGEARFEALCHAYINEHPSRSPNLNFFGRHMATFCAEADRPGLEGERAFCADLARLEWAFVEAIHAPSPPGIDLAALQGLPVEAFAQARFTPSPTVRLLRFDHPVDVFYTAFRLGEPREVPAPGPCAMAIYRHDAQLWRMTLTPAMARVLGALLARAPFEEALSQLAVDEGDPEAVAEAERSVMVWFREWVSSGFFAAIDVPSSPP